MTDYHSKVSGSVINTQTDSYINNENTDNIIAQRQQKIHKKIILHRTFQHQRGLSIRKKYMLGDSMVKHIRGWDISSKLDNKDKVYVRSFSSAKVKFMKDYSKPCIKEDKPCHLILHVGTKEL